MRNPDKHIRTAFYNALTAAGLKVYDKRVPKSIKPGDEYIIIWSQTNLREQLGRGCGQEDCTISLHLYVIQDLGYVSSAVMDDLVEVVMNTINASNLIIPYFQLNQVQRDGSPLDVPTPEHDTLDILRKVMNYRLRVEELTQVTP